MQLKKLFSVLFLWVIVTSLSAQTYYFDNYSVKQGLSQSTVRAVFQDNEGYIWLGNGTGVSKFDGIQFINYTTNDGLAGNSVRSLMQDANGSIWFGHSGGGISRYLTGVFEEIHFDSLQINSDVSSIVQDKEGNIWIGTVGNGVVKVTNPSESSDQFKFLNYKGREGLSDRVFQVHMDEEGQLYFITDAGIKTYDVKKDEFTSFKLDKMPSYFQVTYMFHDSKGNMWLGTYNGGLYKFSSDMEEYKVLDVRDGLAHNWISTIAEHNDGDIWVGTWGGGITRISGNRLKNYNTGNGLHDIKIFSICEDREGNMLIGTNENGLDVYKGGEFVHYSKNDGLRNEQVWAIVEDNVGDFWLGTNEGLAILTQSAPREKQFVHLNYEDNFLSSDNIRFIQKDRYGNIWVGTNGGGVMRFNLSISRNQEYMTSINQIIDKGIVTAMDVDIYDNLWVGTLDGIIKYNSKFRSATRYTQTDGLSGNDITAIYSDNDGVVWVGSRGKGLNKIAGKKIIPVDIGGDITVNSLVKDKDGMLWVGTDGQGIMVIDKSENIVQHYTTSDGLLADLITLINVDNQGSIWIGTNKGLNNFMPGKDRFYSFTEKNGFVGIEAKNNASYVDSKGNIWFGTVNGAMKYNIKRRKQNLLEPLTHITALKVNLKEVNMNQEVEFDHTQKNFNFTYNSIYLTNSSSLEYLVMLEGIDENWSFPTKLTFANYPALPPGDYTFKVKAGNNLGVWNEQPEEFKFRINPPFWQTWWFYLVCLILITTGIIYFIKYREQALRKEKKVLEEKVAERTAEVVSKNDELASKNKDITDSIRYAKRIQSAILPPDEMISQTLKNAFIMFRPKDIVSGDFYWVAKKDNKTLFAAVDCTGHGVPGAFMSIIGHNSLDKIINETDITRPSEILDELNRSVSNTLRQKGEDSSIRDGMDISLISLDMENMELEYAAAHNSLYLVRDNEIIETKADKFAIGSFIKQEKRNFQNHVIKIQKGDVIYAFSDGYADQFGGEAGKKFKYRPFKELLLSVHKKPAQQQKDEIETVFVDWLGGVHEQIDDVLIIGVKI